jgi:ribonuclease III
LSRKRPSLEELAERIGYDFCDAAVLKLALTHASARLGARYSEDNERLEFLGDRVLGLAVAELLHERFPEASEGELARWLNRLVRAETCVEIAEGWELGKYMVMSTAEAGSGGREKKTILANACEAVLGAVFLDGGYAPARDIVQRFWSGHLDLPEEAIPDAKSVLQEWAQGRKLSLPRYVEIAREGPDHKPSFTAEVHVDGMAPERGQGTNKRAAEQAAAEAMLRREGVWQALPHA